nr:SGNH/GDSL hydrolase family protein [uncultured Lichenicoccus sp.]
MTTWILTRTFAPSAVAAVGAVPGFSDPYSQWQVVAGGTNANVPCLSLVSNYSGSTSYKAGQLVDSTLATCINARTDMRFYVGASTSLYTIARYSQTASGTSVSAPDGVLVGRGIFIELLQGTLGTTQGTLYTASGWIDTSATVVQNATGVTICTLTFYQGVAPPAGGGAQTLCTGTQLAQTTYTFSDSSAVQSLSGNIGFCVNNTAGTPLTAITQINFYSGDGAATPGFTLSGPSTGTVGTAGTYTVTPTGTIAASTVTPSGSNGGTFSPTSLSFAAGATAAQTFTFTPANSGTNTVTIANNQSYTTAASSETDTLPGTTIAVTSAAFQFSPGNWRGDTGRAGSVYRKTWYCGAWFKFTWTTGASPTAQILFGSTSTGSIVSYYLNGALTDNVAANANVTLSGLVANATNTLIVHHVTSPFTGRWNGGVNQLQVNGMQIDGASSAGTTTPNAKWGLIVGDSITEGHYAGLGGGHSVLYDYSHYVAAALDAAGYDTCISACGANGFLTVGDSSGDVPAYYYVSGSSGGTGGTYSAGSSRWNLIDQGVSLLDTANQISSYGSTGTSPSFVMILFGTNEIQVGTTQELSDYQSAITKCMTALRAAAPNALLAIMVPVAFEYAAKFSTGSAWRTGVNAAVSAYKAANPMDSNVGVIDVGLTMASQVYQGQYMTAADQLHPTYLGHALIAPTVAAQLIKLMNAGSATTTGISNRWSHF